jgi:hypothetical protein
LTVHDAFSQIPDARQRMVDVFVSNPVSQITEAEAPYVVLNASSRLKLPNVIFGTSPQSVIYIQTPIKQKLNIQRISDTTQTHTQRNTHANCNTYSHYFTSMLLPGTKFKADKQQ